MERKAPGRRGKKNRATSLFVLLVILFLIAGFLARRIMAPTAVHYLRTLPPSGDLPSSTGRRSEAGGSKADGSRQGAQSAFPNAYSAERNREDLTTDERQALDRVIRERSHAPEGGK